MTTKPKALKRRLHTTVWDNTRAYLGTRCVHDFGLQDLEANEWLERGEWLAWDGIKGQNLIYSLSPKGDLLKRVVSDSEATEWQAQVRA